MGLKLTNFTPALQSLGNLCSGGTPKPPRGGTCHYLGFEIFQLNQYWGSVIYEIEKIQIFSIQFSVS